MFKKLASLIALLLFAALVVAPPARALDLSLDGNLIGSCGTATASAGAATLNNKCGTITSESLTTLKGSSYTLTLTNSVIATGDIMLVQVGGGTNTTLGSFVQTVNAAAGSASIVIMNNATGSGAASSGASLNGTIGIRYLVIKP